MKTLTFLSFFLLITFAGFAQDAPNKAKLKVFIDCQAWCDLNYIRSEINIVDFLSDRKAVDVHVLITSRPTGSGGSQGQLIFYGQNRFSKSIDSLWFNTQPNATEYEVRNQLVKYLQLGLAFYIAKTSSVENMRVFTKSENGPVEQLQTSDPWKYWVIRLGGNGNFRVDQVYKQYRLNTNFSVSQITDNLKVRFSVNAGQEFSKYTIIDTTSVTVTKIRNEDFSLYHLLVKSINEYWSYGYETSFSRNTFSNIKSRLYFSPAIEYSFFPYQMVNNKFLTLRTGPEVRDNHYYELTIYDKEHELLWGQKTELSLSLNQKWGAINQGIIFRNYFHDLNFYYVSVNAGVDIRITGGLAFNISLYGALVHDQINLVKGEATKDEILTRVRQLGSNYSFSTWFGLNYRFGSKFNNFVNPRFD
jgi:hypothetical protein